MSLNLKITNFEGPLDLLLHLIKKDKMDIYDISIWEITNNYIQYIREMENLDMEVTSEFIVMASTLIEIKSKMLLPKVKEENEEEGVKDPRKELVDKLIQYKKFKHVAEFLKDKFEGTGEMYSKKPEIIEVKEEKMDLKSILKGIDMLKLYNLYNSLMKDYLNKLNLDNINNNSISVDKYKIEDKMKYIDESINIGEKKSFTKLIEGCKDKLEIIVIFCAMLELIKLKCIKVYQEVNFNEIYLERVNVDEG